MHVWVTETKTHRPVCAYESGQLVSRGLYLQFDTYPSAFITPSNWLISKFVHSKFPFYSQDHSSAKLLLFSICSVPSAWLPTSLPLIINIHLPPSSNVLMHLWFSLINSWAMSLYYERGNFDKYDMDHVVNMPWYFNTDCSHRGKKAVGSVIFQLQWLEEW